MHQHCSRGFENHFSTKIHKEIRLRRMLVTKSVLKEQLRQRLLGINDDESIRSASVSGSQWARDKAHELGIQDSNEALAESLLKMPLYHDFEDHDQLKCNRENYW